MRRLVLITFGIAFAAAALEAQGRKPGRDEEFPDYNRLEYHPVMPDPSAQYQTSAPAAPAEKPSPLQLPPLPADDFVPRPPPKTPPTADGSEPPLPDDLLSTLVPSTGPVLGPTLTAPAPTTLP